MTGFEAGEARWVDGLAKLRNVIRQELIARQLAAHVEAGMRVLDVGCGQGTQAIRLAQAGCQVTGIDPSTRLLERCAAAAAAAGVDVELLEGAVEELDAHLGDRRFDLVCLHGVLMYLPDRTAALSALARRLSPKGRLSITFRNGHALAMRPGLRGDWAGALAAFDDQAYVNGLGVEARADRLDVVERDLAATGLSVEAWYGVRVLNDAIPSDAVPPATHDLSLLLDAEEQAGCRDPYRWLASQLHVIAQARPA
jgi:S-adenosylmethionine-dependent methyltransferase